MRQICDSTCAHCARHFFSWYRSQRAEGQTSRKQRSGPGDRTAAAATSIRPAGARAGVQATPESFGASPLEQARPLISAIGALLDLTG